MTPRDFSPGVGLEEMTNTSWAPKAVAPRAALNVLVASAIYLGSMIGTNATGSPQHSAPRYAPAFGTTNADGEFLPIPRMPVHKTPVHELTDRHGLPVILIAELAGVSRRTVHNWLNDSNVRPANLARLELVASVAERLPADGRPLWTRLDDASGSASFRTLFKANDEAGVERKLDRMVALGGRVRLPMAPVKPMRREVFEDDADEDNEPEVPWDPPTFGRALGVVLLAPGGAKRLDGS